MNLQNLLESPPHATINFLAIVVENQALPSIKLTFSPVPELARACAVA